MNDFTNILNSLGNTAANVIGAVQGTRNASAAAEQSSAERLAASRAAESQSKLIKYGLAGVGGLVLLVVVVMLFRRK